jgi:hypothetical protein
LTSSTSALFVWHKYDLGASEFDGTIFDFVERAVLAIFFWLAILLNDNNQFTIQNTIKLHNGFDVWLQSSNCQLRNINGMRPKNQKNERAARCCQVAKIWITKFHFQNSKNQELYNFQFFIRQTLI